MGASNKTLDNSILTSTGAKVREGGVAGENIDAGQAVYQNSATQRYMLAIGNTAATADCKGFARHPANTGQPLEVIYEGDVTGLTGLTPGKIMVVSDDSAGDVMESDDIGAGDYVTVMGIVTSATTLRVGIVYGGVAASEPAT